MPSSHPTPNREQSLWEEVANSASHGLGLVAGLIGAPILIVNAAQRGDVVFTIAVCIFSITIFLLYLSSTIYHGLRAGNAKRVFRVLDHSAIYLLIAGTYTPFTLGVLRGNWGWTLFGLIWSLAIVGVVLKAMGRASHPMLSIGIYLVMGWLIVIALVPMIDRVPLPGLLWLLAGGMFYSGGVVFYATDSRLKYGHLAWHFFVLAGTVSHYFAVLWYAA
jgi:hemolysin III